MLRPALGARVGLRLAQRRPPPSPLRPAQRRTFMAAVYEPLSQMILNTPLPSYTLTIVMLTIALRTAITLPVTVWQRKRMARIKDIIKPEMAEINKTLAVEKAHEGKRKRWTYDEYLKELKTALADKQAALHRKHKSHPTITMLVPLAVNIPILVTTSMAIRAALNVPNSPMAAESIGWLTALGDPDPTIGLPLIFGALAFANAEVAARVKRRALDEIDGVEPPTAPAAEAVATAPMPQAAPAAQAAPTPPQPAASKTVPPWEAAGRRKLSTSAVSSAARPRRRVARDPGEEPKAAPKTVPMATAAPPRSPPKGPPPIVDVQAKGADGEVDPKGKQAITKTVDVASNLTTFIMRGFSVAMIGVAMIMPSALVIYWASSMSYTLAQSSAFAIIDKRKHEAHLAAKAAREAQINKQDTAAKWASSWGRGRGGGGGSAGAGW